MINNVGGYAGLKRLGGKATRKKKRDLSWLIHLCVLPGNPLNFEVGAGWLAFRYLIVMGWLEL